MPEGPIIYDRAYFDSAEWRQQKDDYGGFGRGAAWVDLIAITNQQATTFGHGTPKLVERGQCHWSKLGLADRWGWSQAKVAATLAHWVKIKRIALESGPEGTVMTLLNYDSYQTGMLEQLVELTANRLQNKPRQRREKGEGKQTVPKGEGEGKGGNHPVRRRGAESSGEAVARPGESTAQRAFKLDKQIEALEEQIAGFETTQPELAEGLEAALKKLRGEREALA